MAVPRTLGLVLVVAVGLAFVVFGVDDVLLSELPPMHRAYAERLGLELPEPVAAMVLAVFAGQGGFFFGSGLALLLLAAGPVRRGEPFACAAALALVVFGNAGIILHLHRLGAPFGLLASMLALGALGVAACRAVRPRVETSGAVHHVDITARDVGRSTAFYGGVLPLLGFRRGTSAPEGPTWAGAGLEVGAGRLPAVRARLLCGLLRGPRRDQARVRLHPPVAELTRPMSAGICLAAAAGLFWLSWALMPGVGVTDAGRIFELVASQRPACAAVRGSSSSARWAPPPTRSSIFWPTP
jgi:hypothetical protein